MNDLLIVLAMPIAAWVTILILAWFRGFVPWRPNDIYVAGWRRWCIRRGIAWSESGFPRWSKAAWRLGRMLAFGDLPKGLAWCATDAMMGGVGEQSADKRARIRPGDMVYIETMSGEEWVKTYCKVVELLEGPLGPSAVVEFSHGGKRGAKGTKYETSDKHDLLPVSCLGTM